mmetsp:Transcript_3825/g.8257  ORF Transcript_3825/g.8257 Transcript_3825/m.8257 type:complete len:521 (+) Transcript_3825:110-1672(+)
MKDASTEWRHTEKVFAGKLKVLVSPAAVVHLTTGLILALEGVAAEEVTLGLHKSGARESLAAVLVVVRKASHHGWCRESGSSTEGHNAAPGLLLSGDLLLELRVDEKVGKIGVTVVRLLDAVKELGADNASTKPNASAFTEVNVPVALAGSLADEVKSLSVRADLSAVESVANILNELLLVDLGHLGGSIEKRGHDRASVLVGGNVASVKSSAHTTGSNAVLSCRLHGHASSTLRSSAVEDHVENVAGLVALELLAVVMVHIGIALGKDLAGDLNEEGVELSLVPVAKDLGQLVVVKASNSLEDGVSLTDALHVRVLDTVVDHLDVVAGARASDVGGAGASLGLGSDLLNDGLDQVVSLARATGHERGAVTCALLTAGDTHGEVHNALLLAGLATADGVLEPFVTTVNKNVTLLEVLKEEVDAGINGGTSLHEEHNLTGLGEGVDELLGVLVALEVGGVGAELLLSARDALINLRGGAVAHGDGEALLGNVEGEVLAHDGQAVESELGHFSGKRACELKP